MHKIHDVFVGRYSYNKTYLCMCLHTYQLGFFMWYVFTRNTIFLSVVFRHELGRTTQNKSVSIFVVRQNSVGRHKFRVSCK
jgi:hypothetical protein